MIRSLGEISDLAGLEGPVNLAVGIFDGVHRGHAAVISAVSEREGTAVALTFDPHPARVLCREKALRQITTLGHKQHILGQAGIECLLVVAQRSSDHKACSPFMGEAKVIIIHAYSLFSYVNAQPSFR